MDAVGTGTEDSDYKEEYSRVLGGKENVACLTLHAEPRETGTGNFYSCTAKTANIPEEILDAVKNSIENCFAGGIRMGYPCADVAITMTDIVYDELTSTPFAFTAAAAEAFDKVCCAAAPQMLEPVMNVDIESPSEFVGEAMSQITQRGGIIQSMEDKSGGSVVHAQAPMEKMFGFLLEFSAMVSSQQTVRWGASEASTFPLSGHTFSMRISLCCWQALGTGNYISLPHWQVS